MSMVTELFTQRMQKESQIIASLPKPRKLHLDWKGKLGILAVLLLAVGIVHWFYSLIGHPELNNNAESHLNTLILITVVSACFLGLIVLNVTRELRVVKLLKAGECAVGKIVSHRRVGGGRGARRQVAYSFPVGSGKPMPGHGTDMTFKYSKDMAVPVFYDPEDISHHVAYCSTWWRIEIRNGEHLEP